MQLAKHHAYNLLSVHGVFALECCDKCGQILGAVRFTRKNDPGAWCSPECRGDEAQQVIRKGGRPRKYKTDAERQRAYRDRLGVTKPPRTLAETKDLEEQKSPLSHTPPDRAIQGVGAA